MLLACEPRGLLRVCTHAAARSHHMSLDMKVCLVRYIRYRWRSHLRTSYLAWGSTLIGCLNPSTCSCGHVLIPTRHLVMRKTSCIIPIQHVHTSPYHTYPYYPFTKHQDYWPSTCHMLVQQTTNARRGCSSASTHLLDRACLKQDPRAQHRIRISTLHFHRQLHAARTLV